MKEPGLRLSVQATRVGTIPWALVLAFMGTTTAGVRAQELPEPDRTPYAQLSAEGLYREACASCHGMDGTGDASFLLASPVPVPDFTECSFASREPDGDWVAVAHEGGPVRGFSPLMPAFGTMLGGDLIQRAMDHIRTLCDDDRWPRGELNFPRAMLTEKAYPEDELVWTVDATFAERARSFMHEVVYEKRFGPRSQVEVVVPFGFRERESPGPGARRSWVGGLGDLVFGVKHALFHSFEAGSIFALGAEVKLPTGRERHGFGAGTTVFEAFASYGQILPGDAFFQLQGVGEFPTRSGHENEAVARGVLGWTYAQQEGWGRAWTPMFEVQAKRELASGESWAWDLVPQFQVTLNTRQHVMMNVAFLVPVTEKENRDPRLYVYLLWDWFDGGFFEGW